MISSISSSCTSSDSCSLHATRPPFSDRPLLWNHQHMQLKDPLLLWATFYLLQRAVTEDRDNANAVLQTARSLTKLNILLLALKITAKFIFLSNVFHAEKQIERGSMLLFLLLIQVSLQIHNETGFLCTSTALEASNSWLSSTVFQ